MFLDFHLIVKSITGEEDSLITTVSSAPVSTWGSSFDRFAGGHDLEQRFASLDGVELRRDRGDAFYLCVGGHDPGAADRDVVLGKTAATTKHDRRIRERLFGLLFPHHSSAYQLLGRSCQQANAEGFSLRLELELDPRLANLPWEWSVCPRDGSWAEEISKAKISWLRYFGDLRRPPTHEPVREDRACVVLVVANPHDLASPALDASFASERQQIERLLSSHGIVVETIEGADTLNQLRHHLPTLELGGRPILGIHYIGHGGVGTRGSYLLGEDASRASIPIDEDELRATLDRCRALRWLFFNACNVAHTPVGSPLAGLTTSMVVLANVPAVVAYQRPIATEDAEGIGTELYKMVLEHRLSFEDALRDLRFRFGNAGGLVVASRSIEGTIPPWFRLEPEDAAGQLALARPQAARGPGLPPRRAAAAEDADAIDPLPEEALAPAEETEMVEVPGGRIRLGFVEQEIEHLVEQLQSERLAIDLRRMRELLARGSEQVVEIAPFEVDQTLVTNARFGAFVAATGYLTEAERSRSGRVWRLYDHSEFEDHPVVHVSYYDAQQFCRWAGKRLLTAEEWILAYRGGEDRLYPWGDVFDPGRCNSSDRPHDHQTTPVTLYPEGASVCGCLDLVGNVEEWTATSDSAGSLRVLGGSWAMRCQVNGLPVFQRYASPHFSSDELGFRCARDICG